MRFAIQPHYQDRGVTAVASLCTTRICKDGKLQDGEVPLGSVEWTQKILGRLVEPDYFPDFLKDHIHRKVWRADKWPIGTRCFIKPAKGHKLWKAKVYSGRGYAGKKPGPYLCSEVVRFRNEYRYYVSDGKVLSGWWYWGDSQDTEQQHEGDMPPDAPQLAAIEFPDGYCGAVDFGELWETGELALIEANAPFSCGWYGDHKHVMDYVEFLSKGWEYLGVTR